MPETPKLHSFSKLLMDCFNQALLSICANCLYIGKGTSQTNKGGKEEVVVAELLLIVHQDRAQHPRRPSPVIDNQQVLIHYWCNTEVTQVECRIYSHYRELSWGATEPFHISQLLITSQYRHWFWSTGHFLYKPLFLLSQLTLLHGDKEKITAFPTGRCTRTSCNLALLVLQPIHLLSIPWHLASTCRT